MLNQETLTREQKIGQLFFIGLKGDEIDSATTDLLSEIQPGGICLFARNIKTLSQTRKLNESLKKILPITPFIALDQEGGRVDRLRRIFPPMPAAADVGRFKNAELFAEFAEISGRVLRQLGFNLNFAPVVDVINAARENSQNGLYSRNLGINAEEISQFARIYLDSIQRQGCFGCLKHFPGLGAIEVDSHEHLPTVQTTVEEFNAEDLSPYRKITDRTDVYFIMTAHAVYPAMNWQQTDANGKSLPASLNPNLINTVLRRELNYSNIILTDDLEMGAIIENYGVADAAVQAFSAGNDMLTICAGEDSIRAAFEKINSAVENNSIEMQQIDNSVERILRIKNLISPDVEFEDSKIFELTEKMNAFVRKIK